jgi:hypothetical protein
MIESGFADGLLCDIDCQKSITPGAYLTTNMQLTMINPINTGTADKEKRILNGSQNLVFR